MVTLQSHVSSILARSARSAAEEIIKLFDSSFEAFTEELHKRQEAIDTLRSKLEIAENNNHNTPGPAYLCVQCGFSLNSGIPPEARYKTHDPHNKLPEDLETEKNQENMDQGETFEMNAPVDVNDAEDCIEFELPPEEDSYPHLIKKDEKTHHKETAHQKGPTRKEESTLSKTPQKRGRGRPRKQPVIPEGVCFEFELPPEEENSYPHLIKKDEKTYHKETAHQEVPARKEDSSLPKTPPKKRGRPRKQTVITEVIKRGRGRPRKDGMPFLKEQSKTFSPQEQPKKGQMIKKESAKKQPAAVRPQSDLSHNQTSLNHVPKAESQSTSKPETQTNKRGRPRKILTPLLVPFGEVKAILHEQENHVHQPDPFQNELQCEFLSKTEQHLPLKNSLKDQAEESLQQKQKSLLTCPKCPRQFSSKIKLQAHSKIHHKKGEITCKICGMTFIGQIQMNNHMRVHTGEKPFSCSFCPRRFPNLSQYKKHMLIHTAPDYACEVCGLRSSQVCKDAFRKAHLRSKEPCSNCAAIYT